MFALWVRTRTNVLRHRAMRKLQTSETVSERLKFAAVTGRFHYDRQLCYNDRVAKGLATCLTVSLGGNVMNKTIHAVFENGVFRPVESVDLPEKSEVEFELRVVGKKDAWPEGYFQQTAGVFAHELFERPEQGMMPSRGEW